MQENIQDLFTEEEWEILKDTDADLCKKVKNLPLQIEISVERMGKDNG